MKSKRKDVWVIVFVLASIAASFSVYYNTLWNDFVWDDHIVLTNQVAAFQSAKDIFFPPAGIQQFSLHYYRPIVVLSYLVDKALWGGSSMGFHFTVILLHVLTTILVFFICRIILKGFERGEMGALIASLLFAVHPIHTESVAWMAGRSDVIAALFFFLSFFFYLKFKERSRWSWLALSSFLFLLAVFGKETSLSLILLLPVADMVLFSEKLSSVKMPLDGKREKDRGGKSQQKKKKKRREKFSKEQREGKSWIQAINLFNYIPFLIATIVYFVTRHFALQGGAQKSFQTSNVLEITKVLVNSYGFYLKKIFLPVNLRAVIQAVPSDFWTTLTSVILLVILLSGIVFSFFKKYRVILFSIIFFLVTLVPSIMVAVLEISETPLAERYLYIPSFSFSLFIAFLVLYIPTKIQRSSRTKLAAQALLLTLVTILLLVFSIQTIKRNNVWKNDLLFWTDLVEKDPDQGYAHLHLGNAYSNSGKTEKAVGEYLKATESNIDEESRAIAFNNLGNIYLERENYDRAEQYFAQAISTWSGYPTPYYSMALSHWRRILDDYREGKEPDSKLMEDATGYLNSAVQLNPFYTKAHGLLGEFYYRLGRYEKARKHLETVIRYEYDREGVTAKGAKQLLERIPTQ